MTNKLLLRLVTVLMLFSINAVQAQTIAANTNNAKPNSRYTVHEGSQTVTDKVTGLMWQQCSVGQTGSDCDGGAASLHNWQAALGFAASANVANTAGYSNWRVPNIKELRSLVVYDRYEPSINADIFPNTKNGYYWSSSPNKHDDTRAWYLSFAFGDDGFGIRTGDYSVRLVRSSL